MQNNSYERSEQMSIEKLEIEYEQLTREVRDSWESLKHRQDFVKTYAWAIPNHEAIETICKYSPIVEIGAGAGYWAMLLQEAGCDIVAYDIALEPGKNFYIGREEKYFPVQEGGEEKVGEHQDRTLFLCWPPYAEPMAYDALSQYIGKTVIFIGEGHGGCTGCDDFFELLESDFDLIETVDIPQFYGIHDSLYVYERK